MRPKVKLEENELWRPTIDSINRLAPLPRQIRPLPLWQDHSLLWQARTRTRDVAAYDLFGLSKSLDCILLLSCHLRRLS